MLMTGMTPFQAQAQGNGINGLLTGAGGGALVGQAIGRDTEATLIGTAVGGMLGYMVGNEMDKAGQAGYAPVPAVFPSPPSVVFQFGDRHSPRPHYRPRERCREVVTYERGRHGRYREVVTTECWERDRWQRGRHWRGDRDWDRHRHDRW